MRAAVSADASPLGGIEKEGIRRARECVGLADLIIVVTPFKKDEKHPLGVCAKMDAEIVNILANELSEGQGRLILHVLNKSDLLNPSIKPLNNSLLDGFGEISQEWKNIYPMSCLLAKAQSVASSGEKDPSGLQKFVEDLKSHLRKLTEDIENPDDDADPNVSEFRSKRPRMWDESVGSTERQRRLLEECKTHLDQFLVDVKYYRKRRRQRC